MKTSAHPLCDTLRNVKGSLKMKSISVLMVGNNPMELGQYCRSLVNFRAAKFTIETAFNSEECFKNIVKFKPAIVVLDDSVGFMSMMEITEKMHSDMRFAHIPVIVVKNASYHHATLKKGVDEFIMLDRVLGGELPYLILETIKVRKEKMKNEREANDAASFDKRISKLLMSFFSPNKVSTH